MALKKLVTDNENLLFIGYDGYEEYYLDMSTDFTGWSFMGLRPETEENLREVSREREIEDYLGNEIPSYLERYIDRERFADDMEEDWNEWHDVQAERENEEGDTLYLGFGSGTDIKSYFKKNEIKDWESYKEHFEFVGLNGREFAELQNKVGF